MSEPDEVKVSLTRTSPGYVSFKGKNYQDQALVLHHPELHLDLHHPVDFGNEFPYNAHEGKLFLRIDEEPTKLYRSNGKTWDPQDKNILTQTSYSNAYIDFLINKIANNEYNPELLNNVEIKRIEQKITNETG